ncbi:polyketide synthase [Marilutibacter chinensis]|uniref:Amino acid adenylation domain-containing protein n=1 Tax=Marilutibacter chinensis TaxID=2912247 RepID=A0ABS9HPT0_9GAMM|nr:polyketide synthase [Lysobacter chinensis]MCF7220949.1 amino acid adenylation domain-containing protein [Lysobacter chinensis]
MHAGAFPQASALLDALPGRPADGESGWQRTRIPLPEPLRAPLGVLDGAARVDLLVVALALAEGRLSGVERVLATRIGPDGIEQGEIAIATGEAVQEGAGNGIAQLAHVDAACACAWVVDGCGAGGDDLATASVWSFSAGGALALEIAFRAPLSTQAVETMAAAAMRALEALLQGQPLDAIDIATPGECSWERPPGFDPDAAAGGTASVVSVFQAVAGRQPGATAVVDGVCTLSYSQLDAGADALAARLRGAGIVPGMVVAVSMRRSVDAIVAVLGILKAGAAYLPLDDAYPPERLAFMLEDADVAAVVVGADGGPPGVMEGVPRVVADAMHQPSGEARANVAGDRSDLRSADSLAYVMYTSGSTGTPKGVEIPDRAILRLVCGVDYIALGPDTRMLHAAPLGFDASTLEIWGPLLNGGCVVVHDERLPTAAGLARSIDRHAVSTAWLTAALFNTVVDDDPRHLAGLKELFTGGEALSVPHVRRMLQAVPGIRLHNGYGPTECTTFACTHPVGTASASDATSIPIGRPIAGTRIRVLNRQRRPLPAGVAGELFIGGAGLAIGYLKRPELTEERFVADPFADGARLYRTGDLVRARADGVIEFIGRADTQVKIRGYRIELGEIEAALARHPGVRSCAVEARAGVSGEKRLLAYVLPSERPAAPSQLREFLAGSLPEFMLPVRYITLDEWPLTPNGKLDRRRLPDPDPRRPDLANAYEPPVGAVENAICDAFGAVLGIEGVGRHDNFFELGGSSLLAVRLAETLTRSLPDHPPESPDAPTCSVATTKVFSHPTPHRLAAALAARCDRHGTAGTRPAQPAHAAHESAGAGAGKDADDPVAIVAMAGRFPGAADVEAFWDNLCEGRDTITFFAPDRLDPSIARAEREDPRYVRARGVIDGVDRFDAAFFGIGVREAELMDPQQRIFLEMCWECLERAGHVPDDAGGRVGVFAGMYNGTYYQRHVAPRQDLVGTIGAFQVMLGNEKDYIATRAANKLNLTGPAVSVHTACSTSLVAVCQAVQAIRSGQCEMALAGGVSVTCPPNSGYMYQEGAMLSPDARTRTFDAQARGTVFSDGAAVVLLKRLSAARADGNRVYALVRGIGVNNDGGHKASFTAPSSEGQAAVIAMAHDDAGIDARSVGYVETHGTATPLGDPIEIEGLTRAFRRTTGDSGFCRVGSLKSNVGHMVIAAGAASVIKTALALSERRIPASLHFRTANPDIAFAGSPFVVNDAPYDWRESAGPRRAGVSSFGVGGTNAHVVLEEAPRPEPAEPADGPQLIVLSARSPDALQASCARLAEHLESNPEINLADVAWTLARGRKTFSHRTAVVCRDAGDAVAQLRGRELESAIARGKPAREPDVVFMFPGQGATYAGMGRALHAVEPVFRDAIDRCARALSESLGFDLREKMFGDDPEALLPTAVMQPATFAIEYALARMWMAQGLTPVAMIGHSVGEFVAATLAGVFALEDALRLVARRGALMQAQPSGGMLSIRLSVDAVAARLPPGLQIAAENAPGTCVVAGPHDAIAGLRSELEGDAVVCRELRTSHAFHSAMMDPVVAPFEAEVSAIALSPPSLPIVSTVTATLLADEEATSSRYWSRHLREPVRFAAALETIASAPGRVLLEAGPRRTLSGLARQHPAVRESGLRTVESLADDPAAEVHAVLHAAGQLWCSGVNLDPAGFDHRRRRQRLRLPTYPFQRRRFWIEAAIAEPAPPTGGRDEVGDPGRPDPPLPHPSMPIPAETPSTAATAATETQVSITPTGSAASAPPPRALRLRTRLSELIEDVAGFDLSDADPDDNFMELGLDSLMLTQVALQLQKTFSVQIAFRQLMGEGSSLSRLSAILDALLPPEAEPAPMPAPADIPVPMPGGSAAAMPSAVPVSVQVPAQARAMLSTDGASGSGLVRDVIAQQMQLMAQQLALLGVQAPAIAATPVPVTEASAGESRPAAQVAPSPPAVADAEGVDEEVALAHTRYDVKKAFGAIARIHNSADELTGRQRARLDAFIRRYTARTQRSKEYTQAHRPHLADPRVVNGFRPLLKEITYQIVVCRSQGARVWDLDGNEYVDALNGFGMNLFGWQPEFVLDAVRQQLELGYEIGPQHPLAGEVAKLVCEVTGSARAALCNTGSEAVMGTIRIARTVTGRNTLVIFTGSYHGIFDEVIVRGTKKLKSVPAAPGILRNTAENVLVLDYGTPETLDIIRERAHEIAAVLVEPVQSRRPDFQPGGFLKELREVTARSGALLIFDEVVTGFRAHARGAQEMFGIDADLVSYGKVVGGGFPIGVIAGKREYMDALDGGYWQFGDDSIPTVGVTYFAGTFVRHPLALAAAKAVLEHLRDAGPSLQQLLNARTAAMAEEMNAFCEEVGAPIAIKHYTSFWKVAFAEDHPLQDLLFAMMRSRGVHILDNFPCFFTTAHSETDFAKVVDAFRESVLELQEAEFIPRRREPEAVFDAGNPPVPGARLGRDPSGKPAWFVRDPATPGKFLKVSA